MVVSSLRRRLDVVPVAVTLLAVGGLAVVGYLDLIERPTLFRAGFTVLGSIVALVLYYAPERLTPVRSLRVSPTVLTNVVALLALGAVLATAELGSRMWPFALVLPIGFAVIALQIRGKPSVPAVLTQLSVLFLAPRLGKYLTTGFYVGGSDTFAHVAAVETLIRARYTPAIPHGYDIYPVFHFLVGTVTHITGLQAYDALVLTGITLFTLLIPVAYLVGASVFGSERLGLATALAATVLEFLAYHSVYFYPQALAVALLLVGLYLNSRLVQVEDGWSYRHHSAFVLALLATMVLTHHLTYLLFAAVAAAAIPVALLRPILLPGDGHSRWTLLRFRWQFPALVGAVLLLAYWSYSPSLIVVGIVQLTLGVLFDVVTIEGAQLYTYGLTLPTDSVDRAMEWLRTPTGLYAAGLGGVLLLAGYELLDDLRDYRRGFTLTVTGLGLSALLLPLPIPIPQIERLKFVVSVVALFPLAVGFDRALSVDGRVVAVAFLLVASLGGATAFTALSADDLGGVYADERREQVSMSESEVRAVGTTAAFLQTRATGNGTVATDRLTNRAFETAQFNATRPLRAQGTGLRTGAEYLVARERWTDHVVSLGRGLRSGDLNSFAVSQRRFSVADATANKVYTTREVRVYRSGDGFRRHYGENGTARAMTLRSR